MDRFSYSNKSDDIAWKFIAWKLREECSLDEHTCLIYYRRRFVHPWRARWHDKHIVLNLKSTGFD